jgi:hypothetical protein
MRNLNLNTVLITVVLALSGWSLMELNGQGKAQATYAARSDAQARELAELRIKVQENEAAIQRVRLDMARFLPREFQP